MKKSICLILSLFGLSACDVPGYEAPPSYEPRAPIVERHERSSGSVMFSLGANQEGQAVLPSQVSVVIEREYTDRSNIKIESFDNFLKSMPVTESKQYVQVGCDSSNAESELPLTLSADIIELCGDLKFTGGALKYKANIIVFNNAKIVSAIKGSPSVDLPGESSLSSLFLYTKNISLVGINEIMLEGKSDSRKKSLAPPLIVRVASFIDDGYLKIISKASFDTFER